ncbi:MAG: IcmT/TraK family protein [Betaproteobacteria bacterium]|nr:IcmT/TraK family protein [Betaproteobacteria bacterium]
MIRFQGAGMYHWSNAARAARFLGMNGYTSILVGIMLFHWEVKFWVFAISVMILLAWIERVKKMTFASFLRWLNVLLVGRLRNTQDVLREWHHG